MWQNINPLNILFLDIETVPLVPSYRDLNEPMQKFWDRKSKYIAPPEQTLEDTFEKAGIYAEFGKIICIGLGIFFEKNNLRHIKLKSFAGDDEKHILNNFLNLLHKMTQSHEIYLCAHNGKEFDFPFIARRLFN